MDSTALVLEAIRQRIKIAGASGDEPSVLMDSTWFAYDALEHEVSQGTDIGRRLVAGLERNADGLNTSLGEFLSLGLPQDVQGTQ